VLNYNYGFIQFYEAEWKKHRAVICYLPQSFPSETKRIEFLFELYYTSGIFTKRLVRSIILSHSIFALSAAVISSVAAGV